MLLWGIVWAALNGRYCGFIAAKSLGAPDVLISTVIGSIAIANLFAVWWSSLVARRPARRFLIPGIIALALVFFSFSLTPFCRAIDRALNVSTTSGSGAWSVSAVVFALQVMAG